MRFFDVVLRNWRISKANVYIKPGSNLLDVGCFDGLMFKKIGKKINSMVGVDPLIPENWSQGKLSLIKGYFPDVLKAGDTFDAITMLAVLEHIPDEQIDSFAKSCYKFLKINGFLIITVPDAKVDKILDWLKSVKILDGMSTEEHHGYDIKNTRAIFENAGLVMVKHATFQLGLNNLFVFQKKN